MNESRNRDFYVFQSFLFSIKNVFRLSNNFRIVYTPPFSGRRLLISSIFVGSMEFFVSPPNVQN